MGQVGVEYTYTSSSSDPDDDIMYYCFDWDDGSTSPWIKQQSNGVGQGSHMWNKQGTYEIRVNTKDIYGKESDWSEPFAVQMPKFLDTQSTPHGIINIILTWLITVCHIISEKIVQIY